MLLISMKTTKTQKVARMTKKFFFRIDCRRMVNQKPRCTNKFQKEAQMTRKQDNQEKAIIPFDDMGSNSTSKTSS